MSSPFALPMNTSTTPMKQLMSLCCCDTATVPSLVSNWSVSSLLLVGTAVYLQLYVGCVCVCICICIDMSCC